MDLLGHLIKLGHFPLSSKLTVNQYWVLLLAQSHFVHLDPCWATRVDKFSQFKSILPTLRRCRPFYWPNVGWQCGTKVGWQHCPNIGPVGLQDFQRPLTRLFPKLGQSWANVSHSTELTHGTNIMFSIGPMLGKLFSVSWPTLDQSWGNTRALLARLKISPLPTFSTTLLGSQNRHWLKVSLLPGCVPSSVCFLYQCGASRLLYKCIQRWCYVIHSN